MSGRAQALVLAVSVAFALVLVALGSKHEPFPVSAVETAMTVGVGLAYVLCGVLVARWRQSDLIGWLLVATGAIWLGGFLANANSPVWASVGGLLAGRYLAPLVHALLVFPSGRGDTKVVRWLVAAAYVLAVWSWVPAVFDECEDELGFGCPGNVFLIADRPDLVERLAFIGGVAATFLLAMVVVTMGVTWRRSTGAMRRVLAPPYAIGVVVLLVDLAGRLGAGDYDGDLAAASRWVAAAAVPVAFLIGALRGRVSPRGPAPLLDEVAHLDQDEVLEAAIQRGLGDPSARLETRTQGGPWLDLRGSPASLDGERAITTLVDTEPAVRLVHDPALFAEPEILDSVATTARLALANAQMSEQLRQQLDEVRRSRARVVAAGDAERARIERNLHDGAQQHLLALAMALQSAHPTEPAQWRATLDQAASDLVDVIEQLRTLSRGLHPPVLSDRGLVPAVESLAQRLPLPVVIRSDVEGRLAPTVEAAAYYVVAESLANVARHAAATNAVVELFLHESELNVRVTDDGTGGAHWAPGGGLVGLQDRAAALGGALDLFAPSPGGTCVALTVPVDAGVR